MKLGLFGNVRGGYDLDLPVDLGEDGDLVKVRFWGVKGHCGPKTNPIQTHFKANFGLNKANFGGKQSQ